MATPERIVPLDNDRFGIFHDARPNTQPTVVFVNAGIVHRVGPHRLYVKAARAFADAGYSCFRFDLSGLGDAAPGHLSYEDQARDDIKIAVNTVTGLGAGEHGLILLGLCSGSENAYKAALTDERIKGLILLDPHSYPSSMAKLERTARKATDLGLVSKKIGNMLKPVQENTAPTEEAHVAIIDRPDPPRDIWAADLQKLINRDVKIYIRYTRYVEEDLTCPEHFFTTFKDLDLRQHVHVEVDGKSDHTSTPLEAQTRLIEDALEWMRNESFDE